MRSHSVDFTGNGADNRDVTVVASFGTPDAVAAKRFNGLTADKGPYIRTSTFTGDSSKKAYSAIAATTDRIQAFGTDTFQVGTAADVNRNGNVICAFAFRDDGGGGFAVFTYTGDGGGARTITPGGNFTFTPVLCWVVPESTTEVYWKCDKNAATASQTFDAAPVTTHITGLGSGSIDVGTALNTNTTVYHVMVWAAGACFTFNYTGNGVSQTIAHGLGERPIGVIVQSTDGTSKLSYWKSDAASQIGAPINANESAFGVTDSDTTNINISSASTVNESGMSYIGFAWPYDYAAPAVGGGHGNLLLLGVG